MSTRVPELIIERYVAGVADASEKARVESSSEAMARAAELRIDNDAIFATQPPRAVAARVAERAGAVKRRSLHLWVSSAVAVACCAAVFVIARPRTGDSVVDEVPEVTRVKGSPRLSVYRQLGDTAEKLATGSTARAGDTLQVAYMAGERTYGAIVSVDGRGSTTIHPLENSGRLSPRGEVVLPRAYTLDDAPRFERFVFVAADSPVNVTKLAQLLHETPESTAPRLQPALGSADIVIFEVRKAPPK